MEPLATGEGLDFSPLHVVAIVLAAVLIVIVAIGLRRFLMAYADELMELWREYGPLAVRGALARRSMPQSPWFCDRCRSRNALTATRCYSCGAKRHDAEAPVPDAEAPAGASGGLSKRTRR